GLLHVTGYKDRPPVRPGIIVSDYLTAVFNAFSLVMALWERDRAEGSGAASPAPAPPPGGRPGQEIDLALYGSVLRIMEHTVAAWDRLGVVRGREGNRLANSAPLDNWETRDGQYVAIVAAGDGLFPRLARMIGREDLLSDPRFSTLAARVAHSDLVNGIVADWCREHDAAEIERLCLAADVPFARTYTVADIGADEHFAARGDLVSVDDPVVGPVRMQGVYPRLSRTPGSIRSGAPRLGEHNDEVYRGLLGLGDAEIERLRAARAI
ncbi:MAG: CaiB/BaiF CoA transferase family protein, partial [Alphaproteobacteria bacterium]